MLESFFIYGDLPANAEGGIYQLPLVILSYLVASFASYTALALAQQLANASGTLEKRLLIWGGAFAMGAGIWSMHFIGMLSYKMDMKLQYDPAITLLSMLIAIAFSYGVLKIVSRAALNRRQILTSGILLGIGICSMHYTGMAAMEMDAELRYTPGFFFLSVAVAIAASAAALRMAFTLSRHSSQHHYLFQIGAALIMGAAICGMHYTGMLAAVFIPWAECRYDPDQDFDPLAISVAVITTIILFLALAVGTYRKTKTEFQLQYAEQRLHSIIDHALDAIVAIDQQGKITEWNKQAEAILGWPRDEVMGKPMAEIIIPPQYRQRHHEGMRKFLEEGASNILNRRIEMEGLRKDGHVFPIELSVTEHKLRGEYHFTAFIRDIAGRKEAEIRLKEYTDKIKLSNQELDDFVYIISHDLKEPLRGLYSYSQFLQEDYGDKLDEEGKKKLETMRKLALRMEELIDTLLYYSRVGRSDQAFKAMDMNEVARKALELIEPITSKEDVEVKIHSPLPTIICDSARVGEIFRNLIINGTKYNDSAHKRIEIGCTADHKDNPGRVVFYVADNGIGIEEKHRETVFKMFKRLHGREAYGGGTGSGLAIVKKIIDRHDGKIWVEPNEGKGSIFYFTLEE